MPMPGEAIDGGIDDDVQRWVGARTGAPRRSTDPVNLPTIRRWYQAMGFADAHGRIPRMDGTARTLAPATMLQLWTHHDRRFEEPEEEVSPITRFERELEADGFTGVLGTMSVQRYYRQLRVGDDVVMNGHVKSISALKRTRLGQGRFITFAYDYRDQKGQSVGLIEMTSLRYRPSTMRPSAPSADAASKGEHAPAAVPDNGMPSFTVPVTATLIVSGALATNDFHRVHHDAAFARATGNSDIIMSIMTSLGLVDRAVWEWFGGQVTIRGAELRLGSPCHPGDELRFSGAIEGQVDDAARKVTVRAVTDRGEHLSALVELSSESTGA